MNIRTFLFSFVDLSQVHSEDDCWDWTGGVDGEGRCRVWIGNKSELAYRLFFELFKGPIPQGLWVLHKCDCVGCCNPNHLYAGTHQDNMNDLANRNRSPWKRNLSKETIELIMTSALSQRQLAKQLNISQSLISTIKNGKREWYKK